MARIIVTNYACSLYLKFCSLVVCFILIANVVGQTGSCYDSDGMNYYTYGYVIDKYGKYWYDACVSYLVEYYCNGNEVASSGYTCPYGCTDGKCNSYGTTTTYSYPTTTYSQWTTTTYYYPTTTIGGGYCTYSDGSKCYSTCCLVGIICPATGTYGYYKCKLTSGQWDYSTLYPYSSCTGSCSGGQWTTTTYYYPTTTYSSWTTTTTIEQCYDSDGGNNPYTSGYVSKGTTTDYDYCSSSTKVKEWYCDGNSKKYSYHTCAYGCQNGACVFPVQTTTTWYYPTTTYSSWTTTTSSSGTCYDFDGGKNIYVKETCSGSGKPGTDYCYSNKKVNEYYCIYISGKWKCEDTRISCPSGWNCVDGKCVSSLVTTTTIPYATTTIKTKYCGDGICNNGERWIDCPGDCHIEFPNFYIPSKDFDDLLKAIGINTYPTTNPDEIISRAQKLLRWMATNKVSNTKECDGYMLSVQDYDGWPSPDAYGKAYKKYGGWCGGTCHASAHFFTVLMYKSGVPETHLRIYGKASSNQHANSHYYTKINVNENWIFVDAVCASPYVVVDKNNGLKCLDEKSYMPCEYKLLSVNNNIGITPKPWYCY